MLRFLQFVGRVQDAKGSLGRLPAVARLIVLVFAVPGIVLLALSILAVLVSILALLLLTVPVYRVLSALVGTATPAEVRREEFVVDGAVIESPVEAAEEAPDREMPVDVDPPARPRRQIDIQIIE